MRPLPPSSAAPFDLGSGPGSVVLIHGYTGTPYEVLPLGQALADAGLRAIGPVLAGHSSSPEELGRTSADAVVDSARQVVVGIQGPVILCGLSMGALVAGLLTAELRSKVIALALLAPAARLHPYGDLGVRLARRGLWRHVPLLPKVVSGGDCGDREGRRRNPGYSRHPVRSLLMLDELAARFRDVLPELTLPVLILHGAHDRTIPQRAAREVRARLGSQRVALHLLPRSRHLLPLDVERDRVAKLVVDFCVRHFASDAS